MNGTSFPLEPQSLPLGAQAPFTRLPDLDSLFLRRAERFDQLAQTRQPKDFFHFMGVLAQAQHAALQNLNLGRAPVSPEVEGARHAGGVPPLAATRAKPGVLWHSAFTEILRALADAVLTPETSSAIRRAQTLDAAVLEAWAGALLRDVHKPMDPAVAPFISAALQVYWSGLASSCARGDIVPLDPPGNCPLCGAPPISAVVSAEPALRGTRYLCCSLCATRWRMTRIKCSNCESTEGIAYYGIEGDDQALKAETCEKCKVYLKLMYMEKEPRLDPVADDTGSIALDLLLAQAGWHRLTPVSFIFTSQD